MNEKRRARGRRGDGEEGAGDRRYGAWRERDARTHSRREGALAPSARLGRGPGVRWSRAIAPPTLDMVVQSEPGERGAITLCLQVHGLAMLRALYGLVMNGAVIDLHAQSQKLIAS